MKPKNGVGSDEEWRGSLVGEGQGVCLNNQEPSHGALREEPSLTGWMRCLLPAHVLTDSGLEVTQRSRKAESLWGGVVWGPRGESSAHLPLMDWEREMSHIQVGGE